MLALLAACVSLPGSDSPAFSRYALQGPSGNCTEGGTPLVLSISRVNVGLDSDRIARRNAGTGEITYLKDVRWADKVGSMAEQRLAQDLECNGFTVLSGHYQKLGQPRLVCEVRALNLVIDGGSDQAEVGFSCLYYRGEEDLPIVTSRRAGLTDWSAGSAVAAASDAYRLALADLLSALR
jgi:ABC-type uncharacterized transport system auxiliary subunit